MSRVRAGRLQRGMTLLELLLVVGVLLVVMGVGIVTYSLSRTSSMAYSAQSSILSLRGVVGSMRKNGYGGMSATAIINAGKAPANMISGGGLVSPWGQPVAIAPVAVRGVADAGYTMTISDMPKEICPDILGVLVEQFEAVDIGGDLIKDHTATPQLADRGTPAVISACQASEAVDVVLTSL